MDIARLLDTRNTRKETRKMQKKLKKVVKNAHHKKEDASQAVEKFLNKGQKKKKNKQKKKKKPVDENGVRIPKAPKPSQVELIAQADIEEEKKFKEEIEEERIKIVRNQLDDDDREIRKYEKLLGFRKRKSDSVPDKIVADGMSDLWEFCDPKKRKKFVETEDDADLGLAQLAKLEAKKPEISLDESDDEWLSNKRKAADKARSKAEKLAAEVADDDDSDEDLAEDDDDAEDFEDFDDEMNALEDMVLKGTGDSEDELDGDSGDNSDADEDIEASEDETESSAIKEDIYGRKVDARTGDVVENVSTSRAREKLEALDANNTELAEQRFKIQKTLRGALNRLNEHTLVASIKTMGELFAANSHNDVKQIFYETFLKATQTVYALPDRLLLEYALFIALTHVNVSAEISGHFVENFTTFLVGELEKAEDKDEKALENAVALLSHLFNFRILKADFIIDLMSKLRDYARDKTVGLMLHAITYAGGTLKKRHGPLLTAFVTASQNFFVNLPADKKPEGSRLAFLIGEFLALKNGNISPITSKFDADLLDHFSRVFKGLTKNSDAKERELPFGFNDVLHIADRGRWWIVGSSWQPGSMTVETGEKLSESKTKALAFGDNLLALAKKAKMNTEIRRNIFCTIVSATDDMEAFERLLKLGLKGSPEREIVHIAVVCVMMEATYNPYYATLIERFCNFHKRFIMTTQFALWDRIKELETLKKRQRINLAFLTADLIKLGAVELSVLKIVDFGIIDPVATAFLRRTLHHLFSKSTDAALTTMFNKLLKKDQLKVFVEGLRLFFELSMRPESYAESPDFEVVKKRVELAEKLLTIMD
uniref:MI domain-containing protein n=1 Tax=Panagrellus redivivus TaxID=6233 RepID=A0A7E4VKX8_PANRE